MAKRDSCGRHYRFALYSILQWIFCSLSFRYGMCITFSNMARATTRSSSSDFLAWQRSQFFFFFIHRFLNSFQLVLPLALVWRASPCRIKAAISAEKASSDTIRPNVRDPFRPIYCIKVDTDTAPVIQYPDNCGIWHDPWRVCI